jgi:DNA-binding MarR family transcriptional regulator
MTDDHFESELRITILRLARRLRAERADDNISDGQFSVMCALERSGPLGLGDLSARERVTAPSMNRTVNMLVESGYVTRSDSPDDGRKVLLDVTDAGRTVISETRRRRDAWLSRTLAELDDAEIASIEAAAPILRRLADR